MPGRSLIPRIVATPLDGGRGAPPPGAARRVAPGLVAATLPGPGRDRLAAGPVLAVTTGQQPALFTGPLYTIYKALSAIALARRLERERGMPVVPVFWVAGDDHDFAEANHAEFLNTAGDLERIELRERPAAAPSLALYREPCGPEIEAALAALRAGTPDTEFKAGVLDWLAAAYRPEASLADAFAAALNGLVGERGLAVLRPYAPEAKRELAPWTLKGLDVTLPDGHTPVLVEAGAGRDRLRPDGPAFVTRRSGERFTREALAAIAAREPQRLSPNVLLRPAVEAAVLPTVAYLAGPGELAYLADARPLYAGLGDGVEPQTPVARWAGLLVDGRVEKVLARYGLAPADLTGPPGALEGRLVREALPVELTGLLADIRGRLEGDYGRLAQAVAALDPTLERPVLSARNSALAATHDVEKKLVASLKRSNETLVGQLTRARAALYPGGRPQERVLTLASFAIRYGPGLVDALEAEVARWAGVR